LLVINLYSNPESVVKKIVLININIYKVVRASCSLAIAGNSEQDARTTL
jgi:hypothetical protein